MRKIKKTNYFTGSNQRLQQFRKFTGLSQVEFSDKIGITQSNLSQMESNPDHTPTGHVILSIISVFPDLNLNWWFFGEGEMLRSKEMKKFDNLPMDIQNALQQINELKREKEMLQFQLNIVEKDKSFYQKLLMKDKPIDGKDIFQEGQDN